MRHCKQMEFSKKAIIYAMVLNTFMILYAVVMMTITFNFEPLVYIIPAVATEVSTGMAFYYWKAKNENRAKYAQQFISDFAELYGIDMAVRISEMVSRD